MERIAEGLRFIHRDRRLMGVLVVTVIYNLFGWPSTSMVPVIGQDTLQLDAKGIGILASMDGVGAFFGALLLTVFLRPAWYALAYVGGIIIYLALLIVFALTPQSLIAATALMLTGLGGAGFSTMQATLVYLASPPEMRSRNPRGAVGMHRRRPAGLYRSGHVSKHDWRERIGRGKRDDRAAGHAAHAPIVAPYLKWALIPRSCRMHHRPVLIMLVWRGCRCRNATKQH